MANRYWVGGTGTWDTTNTANWSATSGGAGGASVPTSADDVFFDSNSGSGIVTILSQSSTPLIFCNNLTTSNGAGLHFGSSPFYPRPTSIQNCVNVYGNATLNGPGTTTGQPTPAVFMRGSSKTLTVTGTSNYSHVAAIASGASVNWNGRSAGANYVYVYNYGTLAVSHGYTSLLKDYLYSFSGATTTFSSGAAFGLIEVQGGTVTLTSSVSTIRLNVSGGTLSFGSLSSYSGVHRNFDISGGSVATTAGSFSLSYNKSIYSYSRFRQTGGTIPSSLSISGVIDFEAISSVSSVSFYNTFAGISLIYHSYKSAGGVGTLTLGLGNMVLLSDVTATTINLNGSSSRIKMLVSSDAGVQRTITASTVLGASYTNFQNISFSVPVSGTALGDGGNNNNITFPSAKTLYIVNGNTKRFYDFSTAYSTSSGGAASTQYPLAHDTVILDSNSGTGGGTFYVADLAIGSFICTNPPANTTLSSSTANAFNSNGFFGDVQINAANLSTSTYIGPNLWGRGGGSQTQTVTLGFGSSNMFSSAARFAPQVKGNGVVFSGNQNYLFSVAQDVGTQCSVTGLLSMSQYYTANWGGGETAFRSTGVAGINISSTGTLEVNRYNGNSNPINVNNGTFELTGAEGGEIGLWDGGQASVTYRLGGGAKPKVYLRGSTSPTTYTLSSSFASSSPCSILELERDRTAVFNLTTSGYNTSSNRLDIQKWSINGEAGNLIGIQGSYYYTGTSPAVVTGSYLNISNSSVAPANTWYAPNSTNGGNNSGWIFAEPPRGGSGFFFGSNF